MTVRQRRWLRAWLVIAGLCLAVPSLAPSLARAQVGHVTEVPDPDQVRARELFLQGSVSYEAAEYDAAIEKFEAAYRLSALPDLLFNIAQAYRQKGPAFCATALRYYERHLQEEPAASNQAEIQELMTEMRRCAGVIPAPAGAAPAVEIGGSAGGVPGTTVAAAIPALAVPPPPGQATSEPAFAPVAIAPDQLARPSAAWPAWTMRAGAAAGLLGLAAYGAARVKYNAVKDSCPCQPGSFQNWERLTNGGYALMAVGAGALTVGLVSQLLLRPHGGRPLAVALAPVAAPGFSARALAVTGALVSLRLGP
jgi:tetratricopeptide (TPR) repeat protein